ncbi:MAG: 1-deoxy-D-xylulose-5-phosphate reductoisomerase [Paramuribaculum sp.]|nr:1-deoxy-D-xylulose-5-phosphate reductoisomerase [Paramuribaculum sp.]
MSLHTSANHTDHSPRRIAVLGSTGSIGTQTLDIISSHPDRFAAEVLVAGRNVDMLIEQSRRFRPSLAVIADESKYAALRDALAPLGISTAAGATAVAEAMTLPQIDTVLTATVGYSGLAPTISAIRAGKDIALANKETLVVAGDLITRMLAASPSGLYPVDSEHSAIRQCLIGEDPARVSRLIITASGGPFRNMTLAQMRTATVEQALSHPNWHMGAKITIDSATMINKAFEIIEARWLFGVAPDKIVPVVHPQSIIHSMVEFVDGAVKAQLGTPDMRLPISFALAADARLHSDRPALRLSDMSELTFTEPDYRRFPCLSLASYALDRGGNTACIINAANEVGVAAFLDRRIAFTDIYNLIRHTLDHIDYVASPDYADYVATNDAAVEFARAAVAGGDIPSYYND